MRRPRWALGGVALGAALAFTSAAAASDQLVISPSDVAQLGFHSGQASAGKAQKAFKAGLPRSSQKLIAHAHAQAAGARNGRERLLSAAFVFASSGAAHRVLVAFKRAHGGRKLRIGLDGSIVAARAGRSATYTLTWREGTTVELVELSAPARQRTAAALAFELAKLADSGLRTTTPPPTAFDQVAAQVEPDGTMPESAALQAFALAYGALPGVSVPPGSQSSDPEKDATLAGTWVLPYLSSLSPQLQKVIDAKLGFTPPGEAREAVLGDPGLTIDAGLTKIAQDWATLEGDSSHLGKPLTLTIQAGYSANINATAVADAYPVDAQGHFNAAGPNCRLRVNPTYKSDPNRIKQALAHETFHCFQFMIGGTGYFNKLKGWVLEGTADWVEETVVPLGYTDAEAWGFSKYVNNQDIALFTRTYDAAGFWGHVQDRYGDLWSRLKAILSANGNDAVFKAAGGNDDQLLSTWGSAVANEPTGSSSWRTSSPIAIPAGTHAKRTAITYDASHPTTLVKASAYTTNAYEIHPDPAAPIVHIQINGPARMSPKYNYTSGTLKNAFFCLASAASCKCPTGDKGDVPAGYPEDEPLPLLVLTGDPTKGTSGQVTYQALSDYCKATYPIPKKAADSRGLAPPERAVTTGLPPGG